MLSQSQESAGIDLVEALVPLIDCVLETAVAWLPNELLLLNDTEEKLSPVV